MKKKKSARPRRYVAVAWDARPAIRAAVRYGIPALVIGCAVLLVIMHAHEAEAARNDPTRYHGDTMTGFLPLSTDIYAPIPQVPRNLHDQLNHPPKGYSDDIRLGLKPEKMLEFGYLFGIQRVITAVWVLLGNPIDSRPDPAVDRALWHRDLCDERYWRHHSPFNFDTHDYPCGRGR